LPSVQTAVVSRKRQERSSKARPSTFLQRLYAIPSANRSCLMPLPK